ncbi:hypothetical protein QT990_25345 [Microcoleus sp. T3_B1]|uniref:hypothetical protein n=1 Tax=Microcoleus sp. T3_B1 TaxID=3055425 RepID=UPI002FD5509A
MMNFGWTAKNLDRNWVSSLLGLTPAVKKISEQKFHVADGQISQSVSPKHHEKFCTKHCPEHLS